MSTTLATAFYRELDFVNVLYIISFSLFIYGLMGLTGPRTAVRGNRIAAVGMALAVFATFLLPGMGKIKKQMEGLDLDNKVLKRQMAIIGSMTPYERRNPKAMDAKRKKRVAAGSGTKVEEINRLLKMHLQMAGMMKQMGQGKGMFGKMFGMTGFCK